ncbi:MAG: 6-bladed beta-propeller [Candidatus Aminicenantes bacterium]|nr:6-bladed beta-propeller [Candidatus Aminicenantes bacterium]
MKGILTFVKISALSFMTILFSYGQNKNDRNVTIENVKGVTYVRNPKQGLWDSGEKAKIRLVQDIQIGKLDGQEEFLFVYISDVAVNGNGDIYVADRRLNEVRKFDKEGRYLLTIGRKGQGPGEFQSIRTLSVNKLNDLFVFDNMLGRISIFTEKGEHKETSKKILAGSWIEPCKIFFHNKGYVLFGKANRSLNLFHDFNEKWDETTSYIEYEPSDSREFEEQSLGFNPGNCFVQDNGDLLYTKYYYDNQVRVYKNEKLVRIITRESNLKKAYEVEVFHDVQKAMSISKDQDYDFKSFGQGIAFIGKSFQNSLGVFQLPNGHIVDFLSIRKSKSSRELWVELFDSTGKLLSFSKLGDNMNYDIRCMDSGGRFYAIERKEYNKVIAFRLEY